MDLLESLLVGEEGCTFNEVVKVLLKEVHSVTIFKNWSSIARELDINSLQIEKWRMAILHDKLQEEDLFHRIFESWKEKKKQDATLANLIKHLREKDFNNVADELREFFSTQNPVHEGGREIFKQTLPKKSNYYIQRTLITRNVINDKVFSSTDKDTFVLDGIDRYRLSQLAKKELTDTSTTQVRKPELSVRFILLEQFGDWALLCDKTTNPIHLLRHHEGVFHWVCTKGDISALQNASEENNQNELSEEKFIDEIETDVQFQTNQPICISDSPGMGKSLLLASIGRQLQHRYPERFIAFIVISEFVVKIRNILPTFNNTEKAMLEELLETLCENNTARKQLLQKITTRTENTYTHVELMFDGFDEVTTENFHLAHECLEILKTNFNNAVRVWVTTRPQHLHELEKRFSVLGHRIEAFQEKHQIDFLTLYWSSQGMTLNGDKLQIFSKHCLSTLNEKLNKKDEDVAGIPLQCMMIADVYMQDAHGFCDPKNQKLQNLQGAAPCIDVNSIADLYEKTIEHKIEKFKRTYQDQLEEIQIWRLHMYLALELIFPSHVNEFKDTLQIGSGLKKDSLVNIGILEHRGSATEDAVRFIHRTFAEYLAARFFVSYVIAPNTAFPQNAGMRLPNFLFEQVFQCTIRLCKPVESTYYECSFKHSVLCHFLDTLLGLRAHVSTQNCIGQNLTIRIEDVIYASIHSDFGNIIRFLHSLKYRDSFCVNDLDSKILVDATKMSSLDLLKFLLQNFEHEPLTAIEGLRWRLTALHAAVHRGNYSILEYILKEQHFEDLVSEDKQEIFRDLVYLAVQNTTHRGRREIQDRIQILEALCDLKTELINYNYCNRFKETPLLADGVNILLLKKLIECGANLLHIGPFKDTILHKATQYLSPTDYYDLLQYIPRTTLSSLLQMRNYYGDCSFHLIVERGLVTQDILNLILSSGVHINTSGRLDYTCIFYALEIENKSRTIPTLKLLLENGADHTRVDRNGDSILHLSAQNGRIDCLRFFLEEKKMNVNQINAIGETPLFRSLCNRSLALETLRFLLDHGADYIILKKRRESLLHVSASENQLECLELFLSLGGLDINKANKDGDTPLLRALSQVNTGETIKLLLAKGADHTISNKEGNTALHILLQNIDNYYLRNDFNSFLYIIEKLLSLGADVNKRNKDGKTPLDIHNQQMLNPGYKNILMEKDLAIRSLLERSETRTTRKNKKHDIRSCLIS